VVFIDLTQVVTCNKIGFPLILLELGGDEIQELLRRRKTGDWWYIGKRDVYCLLEILLVIVHLL